MSLIQKHYLKEFIKTLCIISIGVSFIFSIVGLIDKMSEFMAHNPPISLLLLYVFFGLPVYLNYLLPVSALFSSLFVFSRAMQRLEIVAIKSAGARMRSIVSPFIVLGIILTLIGFLIGEILSPKSFKKLHNLRNKIVNKTTSYALKEGVLYMRGKDGSVIRIALYLPELRTCKGISIFRIDEEGFREKIEAPSAQWTEKGWVLENASITNIKDGTVVNKRELLLMEIDSPEIFQSDIWKSEEMTITELLRYKERLNNAGFKNMKLDVEISSRLTYSFVNLIMLMLGMSLTLSAGKVTGVLFQSQHTGSTTHNNVLTAGIGVLISLLYWFGYTFFLSLGYTGAVPPFIAPVIVPALFFLFSLYLYNQIQE